MFTNMCDLRHPYGLCMAGLAERCRDPGWKLPAGSLWCKILGDGLSRAYLVHDQPKPLLIWFSGLGFKSENYYGHLWTPKIHFCWKPQVPNLNIWQFMWGNKKNSVYASFRSTQPLDQNRVPPGCLMIHRFKASEFFDRFFFWVANLKQFENRSLMCRDMEVSFLMGGGTQIIQNQRIVL